MPIIISQNGIVVEQLCNHGALIGVPKKLRFNDVDFTVLVNANGVDRSAPRREFAGNDGEPDMLLDVVERYALRIKGYVRRELGGSVTPTYALACLLAA